VAGFLRFVVFFGLLLGVFVLVVLPFLLSPLLAQMVRDAGLRSQTLEVSVAPLDPTLLLGRSRLVTLVATDVDAAPARIGRLEVAFGQASYFDRTFETVSGELADVVLTVGGDTARISTIRIDGPSDAANATATLDATETEELVRVAARRVGVRVDSVIVSDTGVTVGILGQEARARLAVQGGALLLDPGIGVAIVLIQPAPSDPWTLREAWISPEGLNVRGVVDMRRIARSITSGN
jgi:hypothetical protein